MMTMLKTAALLTGGLLMITAMGSHAASSPAPLRTLPLPSGVSYPEGVAYDPTTRKLFAGSAVDGVLLRIDPASRQTSVLTPPGKTVPNGSTFPAMLGMKHDGHHRLWIAGGSTGMVSVVDSRSGRILKQSRVNTAPKSLLNDLVLVGSSAFVTDTFVPMLWRMSVNDGWIGELEPWLDLRGTPIAFADGPNLNGIAATPDGRTLIVVQMNKGRLYRIDIATRHVEQIDIGDADIVGTDGLVLDGSRLYAVGQWKGEIVTFALDAGLRRARVVSRYKDAALAYPATAAKVGNHLVVVNAQFNRHDTHDPQTPFTLVEVPLARLQGR